ncbi:MAG: hypothetical protein ABI207_07590 [Crocinitomicaceae bacterium]
MNIESIKIDLAKQLFSIDKASVLEKIKQILDKEEIVAYTVDGKPLSREAYIKAVKNSEQDIDNGNYVTHGQLLENSKKW